MLANNFLDTNNTAVDCQVIKTIEDLKYLAIFSTENWEVHAGFNQKCHTGRRDA